MMKSMTGFGRYELTEQNFKLTVEMKSVNHRYLDLTIKMPKRFNCFESAIRNQIKEDVQRGKVDMYITFEDYSEDRVELKYNRSLAAEYMKYFAEMSLEFDIKKDVTVSMLAKCPEVFSMEQADSDEEELWQVLSDAIRKATENFVKARETEGEQLRADLQSKLDYLGELVKKVEERSPQVVAEYRAKLYEKLKEVLENSSIDENRILTEAAVFADKVCVDEEMVRLKTHISHMRDALTAGSGIGRKLDFLAQEMNREANTTLSKANDVALADIAIDMKTEIEKIREQVQNIE
ncbi:MAG: YicC family protein [Lachnospiraceae bacterium]|nr:YicC family protein [Lachnospiraceae bacterium]